MRRNQRLDRIVLGLLLTLPSAAQADEQVRQPGLVPYLVSNGGIAAPLTATPGDPQRGQAIVAGRTQGNCLTCHRAPIPNEDFQGEIGPDLHGVGRRLSVARLRLRVVDARRQSPDSVMPPFYRTGDAVQVAAAQAETPLLTAQQVEDVVSYLASLTETPP
ncbi:sulfur oxidation c-type cytochrome SoxX [Insolitispirillum peregrinum]